MRDGVLEVRQLQRNLDDLGIHLDLLGRLVAEAANCSEIEALALGGSLARGTADRYSDIDLFIMVAELTEAEPVDTIARWVRAIRGISVLFPRGVGPEGYPLVKAVHARGVVLDFHILRVEGLRPLFRWRSRVVIYDRTGALAKFVDDQLRGWTNDAYCKLLEDSLGDLVTDFWLRYAKAFSYVLRGNLFLASRALWNMSIGLASLVRWKYKSPPSAIRAPLHYIESDLCDEALRNIQVCLPDGRDRRAFACAVAQTARTFEREVDGLSVDNRARQIILGFRPIEMLEELHSGSHLPVIPGSA